jgi:hypothetical protein
MHSSGSEDGYSSLATRCRRKRFTMVLSLGSNVQCSPFSVRDRFMMLIQVRAFQHVKMNTVPGIIFLNRLLRSNS